MIENYASLPNENNYPIGTYNGIAGGYIVQCKKLNAEFKMERGVRGINIPCVVDVTKDKIVITSGSPEYIRNRRMETYTDAIKAVNHYVKENHIDTEKITDHQLILNCVFAFFYDALIYQDIKVNPYSNDAQMLVSEFFKVSQS